MTIDLSYFRELTGSDKELFNELIELLIAEFEENNSRFKESARNNDAKEMAEVLHILKNKIGILKLEELRKEIDTYESELINGNIDRQKTESLTRTLNEILHNLKN